MTPVLSILICSLEDRKPMLDTLVAEVKKQSLVYQPDVVEWITCVDTGQMRIGEKRNHLIAQAKGEYIAFVDDDDLVSENYVRDVVTACQKGSDCVELVGRIAWRRAAGLELGATFRHSIDFVGWYTGADGVFYRTPNHLNPIRREIAERVGFYPVDFGEDKDYSQRILGLLKTEAAVDEAYYLYVQRDVPEGLV